MKVTNEDRTLKHKNLKPASELTRAETLAVWQKVIFEHGNMEDYFEHYKEEKKFQLFYTRIETNFPRLAEALSDENESHLEGILILGNEALRNIKVDDYRRPKRGYLGFLDNPRLNAIALGLRSEEQTKKAAAKATAGQRDKVVLTLEEVLELEDSENSDLICNYCVLKKENNGHQEEFFVKSWLNDTELKQELTDMRAIPIQTAPGVDFYTHEYDSWSELYGELKRAITDYIAFPNDSIAPDLIALGSMASYFREVYYTYPYYDFISSEPESGKTTAMKVQTFLSFYGTIAASVTEALLFREIDESHCFYGLDNIERLFASPKDYASIIDWLLSSYSRDIPCKRLEKTEEGYEVRYFDGYGIKAFTHIRDFPFALRALRSRCVQIIMQNAKPRKFYPSAAKFTEIRDKLYKARLYEFESVKKSYEQLIASNVLSGRTGDLYYPLLSIAKLVDEKLYQRVLHYATTDEVERKELDSWNRMLITVLLEKELIGSHSTNEIREFYEEALTNAGLLKDSTLHTRTITMRLKKLGFTRDDKKTDHKTWFIIDREKLMTKAYAYGILDEDKLEKNEDTHTTPKGTLLHFVTFDKDKNISQEGTAERGEEDKTSTEEIENSLHEDGEKVTKVTKLPKRGVCEDKINCISPVEKGTCERCGENHFLDHEWIDGKHKCLICSKCAEELKHEEDKPRAGISLGDGIEYQKMGGDVR